VWLYYLLTAVFSVLAIGLPSGRDKLVALAGLVVVLLALLAFIARRGAGAMTKKG
jgi:succinate-acetate transporter protein